MNFSKLSYFLLFIFLFLPKSNSAELNYIDHGDNTVSNAGTGKFFRIFSTDKINKYVSSNGFAYFGEFRTDENNSTVCLIPIDEKNYPLLTAYPYTAFFYFRIGRNELERISVEKELIQGLIYSENVLLDLEKIEGFSEYYRKYKNLNKFEKLSKKPEFIETFLKLQAPYLTEYEKFLNSIFVIVPLPDPMPVHEGNYDLDKKVLNIKLADNNVIVNNSGYGNSLFYYVTLSRDQYIYREFKNIPLIDTIKIPFSVNDASRLFSKNDSLSYVSHLYVRPTDRVVFDKSKPYHPKSLQGFDIVSVVFNIFNPIEDKLILSIVLHDFNRNIDEKGNLKNFTWNTNIVEYETGVQLKPINPLSGKWRCEPGSDFKSEDQKLKNLVVAIEDIVIAGDRAIIQNKISEKIVKFNESSEPLFLKNIRKVGDQWVADAPEFFVWYEPVYGSWITVSLDIGQDTLEIRYPKIPTPKIFHKIK